ncbi:hypothetical protein AB432_007615 [Brevibacillus brevis]|uniref:Uncharacterized protein n=2 Tax=Brevibacillus brevis TaxID=1393 RepID=A0A2Z4MEM3_BREBE|nr:hypothetical protein AB432_007615 [Brevibacillus brevis]
MDNYSLKPIIVKTIKTVHSYYLLIPLLVYFVGFIYTQGTLSPYTGNLNIWNNNEFLSLSLELYFINGAHFLTRFGIGAFLASILIESLSDLLQHLSNSKIFKSLQRKYILSKNIYTTIIKLILIFSPFFCLLLFPIIGYVWYGTILNMIIVFTYFSAYKVYKIQITKDIVHLNSLPNVKLYHYFFIAFMSLSFIFHVYLQGSFSQATEIDKAFNKGEVSHKLSTVYYEKNNISSYLKIDITKEYFVGFNYSTKKIEVIPISKINKIESWDGSKEHTYRKMISGKTILDDTQKKINSQIDKFYNARLKANASELISMITKDFYQKEFRLISPEILRKKWTMTNELHGQPLKDFLGVEMSVPTYSEESKTSYIAVVEYWKEATLFYKITLKLEDDGLWRISNTERTVSFQFSD